MLTQQNLKRDDDNIDDDDISLLSGAAGDDIVDSRPGFTLTFHGFKKVNL